MKAQQNDIANVQGRSLAFSHTVGRAYGERGSKKRKHFQRKIGSVKLAIDTYHGDSHDLLIIADNCIIDLLNGVEYICTKSDYELIVDIGNGER